MAIPVERGSHATKNPVKIRMSIKIFIFVRDVTVTFINGSPLWVKVYSSKPGKEWGNDAEIVGFL